MASTERAEFPPPPVGSRLLLRVIQAIARYVVPRGLPRITWLIRRLVVGRGIRVVWFEDRFHILCNTDSYPEVVAVCGFVYRRMDALLRKILAPPAVFLDVGANVGLVSLLACSVDRSQPGVVIAHCFEPDPHVFVWLSRNRDLNGGRFTMVLNACAVGEAEGQAPLTVSARPGWSTMATPPPGGFQFLPEAGKVMVPVTTLDAYCAGQGVSPTVIKIDAEGFESRVLAGAQAVLREARPYLILEINPLRLAAAKSSSEELLRPLSSANYCLFHVDPRRARRPSDDSRRRWRGYPEVKLSDAVMGEDFDVVAIPAEVLRSP